MPQLSGFQWPLGQVNLCNYLAIYLDEMDFPGNTYVCIWLCLLMVSLFSVSYL